MRALAGVALVLWAAGQPLTGQEAAWSTRPGRPTVGDTVWLERVFATPSGWRVRPGRIDNDEHSEPLADATVERATDGWLVRYAVAGWSPGHHVVAIPPVWRLGPDGRADSVPGGTASFDVRSVIPDSVTNPRPQPASAPLRRDGHDPRTALALTLVAVVGVVASWRLRRRGPRRPRPEAVLPTHKEVADDRWLAAGESKAVAARAAAQLRAALARAVPAAQTSLSTAECLAALATALPPARLHDVTTALTALDAVAFAAGHETDVVTLARRARQLAAESVT
jgi:hypothetical protein